MAGTRVPVRAIKAFAKAGGTGTSAMMAMYEARGLLTLQQPIRSEGLLGSGTFEGCLIGETSLNGTRAVRPTVKGTAGLLGTARWTINRDDPVDAGFLVAQSRMRWESKSCCPGAVI